jgi:hypothetical protein
MAVDEEESLFPASREAVWARRRTHLADRQIGRVHHLPVGQKTIYRWGADTVVVRWTDVRGMVLKSRYKLTHTPPESAR